MPVVFKRGAAFSSYILRMTPASVPLHFADKCATFALYLCNSDIFNCRLQNTGVIEFKDQIYRKLDTKDVGIRDGGWAMHRLVCHTAGNWIVAKIQATAIRISIRHLFIVENGTL